MTRPRRTHEFVREPVALAAPDAAAYLGIGETAFRRLVGEGIFSNPMKILGRVLWDADPHGRDECGADRREKDEREVGKRCL